MKAVDVIVNSIVALKDNPKYLIPSLVFLFLVAVLANIIIIPQAQVLSNALNATGSTPTPAAMDAVAAFIPNLTLFTLFVAVVAVFLIGLYADLVYNWRKGGSLMASLKVAMVRFPSLLLYAVIISIVLLIIILVALSIALSFLPATVSSSSNLASQISFGVFVIVSLILAPFVFCGCQIVVIDNKGAIDSIKAAIEIGLRDFLGIISVIIIFFIVFMFLYFVIAVFGQTAQVGGFEGSVIGVIALVLLSFLLAFAFLIQPMYYISFARSMPSQPAPELQESKPRHHGKRKSSR